jgi:hypothetical protein
MCAQSLARLSSAIVFVALSAPAEGSVLRPHARGAPELPALVTPAAQCTLTVMPPHLTVTASDPDDDSLTVTYYGRSLTAPAGPDFTLIEIPDTQYYSSYMNGGSPGTFTAQCQWIASQRAIRNIAYVAHVGDIVEHQDNNGNPVEWMAADHSMQPLEDADATLLPEGLPFGVSPGSHDIAGSGATVFYDQFFGLSRFSGRSYYGGHYGGDNANWFNLFSASGLDFIVIGLKLMWTQAPGPVQWADSLLAAYPNRRAIIVSHYLLDPGPPVTFSPQGQVIYNALKSRPNLMLMICGHYVDEARRSDTFNGHTVHTVMANYQNRPNGGNGWLRIMEFSPTHNQIRMRTYSPTLGTYEIDPDSSSQFTLNCDLSGGDHAFHPIGTFRRVPSGTTVSIPWAGLQRDKYYEWYVTVSDGSSTVTGPVWGFESVEAVPPVVEVTAPTLGAVLTMGQRAALQWSATDPSGIGGVDILLSRSGSDGPWQALATNIPDLGVFNWWVTGPPTTNACIRVVARDTVLNEGFDDGNGQFQIVSTTGVAETAAGLLALEPVVPNPTTGHTRFGVVLPEAGKVRLFILDVGGRMVEGLANGFEPAGRKEFAWDGSAGRARVPAGVYFVRLEALGRVLTQRFTVAR